MLKIAFKYLLGLAFAAAGANHFVMTEFYLRMMPPYLPWHFFLVYLSGVIEFVLGVALLVPRFTRMAAWGMIALCVAVFPANLHMALHAELFPQFSEAALWWRLPGQLVIVFWAWWMTRVEKSGG